MKPYSTYYNGHYCPNYFIDFIFKGTPQFYVNNTLIFSVTPAKVAKLQAHILKGKTVIIPFCGSGMDAIYFAKSNMNLILTDSSNDAINLTKKNLSISIGSSTINKIISKLTWEKALLKYNDKFDCVYLDPPWGGPEYANYANFTLDMFEDVDGEILLESFFSVTDNVLLKLPFNFKMNDLKAFGLPFTTYRIFYKHKPLLNLVHFGRFEPDKEINFRK
jgi:16S rRNA G966 N2-methylase RsmD